MEVQGCARWAPVLLMEGHLHGSLLSCHGDTELPGLRELEEALVSPRARKGSEQRAGTGVYGGPAPSGIPQRSPMPLFLHPAPSVSLLPFQSSFFRTKFLFPLFFPLLSSPLASSLHPHRSPPTTVPSPPPTPVSCPLLPCLACVCVKSTGP